MENKPKISVIIPTWNSDKTLKATIESCLNQTLPPIEILVCDDGSTDDSKKIVEEMNDSRVKWIPLSHSGTPAVPRNKGIELSKGEWIAFCDSDDEWLPQKLEKQVAALLQTKYKAISTNAFQKINNTKTNKKIIYFTKKYIGFINLLQSNSIICSSTIIHKSLFNKIGGFTENINYGSYADYIYWLKITTETKFIYIEDALTIYNDHPETSMRKEKISDKDLKNNSFNDFIIWSKTKKNQKLKMLFFRLFKFPHLPAGEN